MKKKEKMAIIIEKLDNEYPDAECALNYANPHEMLIAVRLSAQCTDKRVNLVTPELFKRFKTIKEFADADVEEIGEYIKSCGLYKTKARDIVSMCRILHDEYNDIIPNTIEELVKLPGVGRKTANLIVGDLYGKPAIVTDTHVIRLSNRLGFVNCSDPFFVEKELRKIVPPSKGLLLCHRLVHHGRLVCVARKPKCAECVLAEECSFFGKTLDK